MPNDYVDNKGSEKSMGVHASNIENSDSKIEDYSLRPSEMKDLAHRDKPLYGNEIDLDATIVSNDHSESGILGLMVYN